MSGAYSLFHVFNELLDEKANKCTTARGKTIGAKSEIYQGAWTAMNAWIETKLAKQKGAGISGFGCFAWELKQKGDVTQCRPIFIISDAFVKNFRVKRERIHRLPQTTAVEEINYSLLAIKFSNSLTKDMVFAGLRDIVKKIGDFIDRGYELEIPFSFGVLSAKERRVKFEFSQSRLQEILPERIEPGTLAFGKVPSHLFDETASEPGDMTYRGSDAGALQDHGKGGDTMLSHTARRVGTAAGKRPTSLLAGDATSFLDSIDEEPSRPSTKVPPLSFNVGKLPLGSTAASEPVTKPTSAERPEHNEPSSPTEHTQQQYQHTAFPPTDRSDQAVPEDLKELLTTLAQKTTKAAKDEFRNQARTRVLEQAYMRCLNSVETGAWMDDHTTQEASQLLDEWRHKSSTLRAQKHADAQDLRKSLDSQMAHNAKVAEDRRLEHKNTQLKCILPESKQGDLGARQAVSKLLEEQIQKNAAEKEAQRQQTLNAEREYLNRLSMEIQLHQAMDRSTQLQKQRSLLEAWERDGHIRNLRKLQPFGVEPVQDYIQRNLATDPYATSTGPLQYTSTVRPNATAPAGGSTLLRASSELSKGTTLSGKLNMSIGYDPRKPKLDW